MENTTKFVHSLGLILLQIYLNMATNVVLSLVLINHNLIIFGIAFEGLGKNMVALSLVLTLAIVVTMSHSFLLDDNSLQNLLNLITQEKKKRAIVEDEIETLKKNVANLKANHHQCKFRVFCDILFQSR